MMSTEEMLKQLLDGQNSINQRLDTMDKRFDTIDKRFEAIDERFDTIDKRFDEVYSKFDEVHDIESEFLNRQDNLQKDVKSIKITLENDISPSIRLLSDLQLENPKRFIILEKNVESLTDNLVIDEVLDGLNNR